MLRASLSATARSQSPRAADIHQRYLLSGQRTCIDCHKGIAHELPDMAGVLPGWSEPAELVDTRHQTR
jgi:cytochrome c-type protein NapC